MIKTLVTTLVLLILSNSGVWASTSTLGADAHCDQPWFYKFNFSGQDVSIEHCGRNDSGKLDYTFSSVAGGEVLIYYKTGIKTTLKLRVNDRSYSQTVTGNDVWRTGVRVSAGDKISFLADMKDTPYSG